MSVHTGQVLGDEPLKGAEDVSLKPTPISLAERRGSALRFKETDSCDEANDDDDDDEEDVSDEVCDDTLPVDEALDVPRPHQLRRRRSTGFAEKSLLDAAAAQLDTFFAVGLRELRKKEVVLEGSLLLANRRMVAMEKEEFIVSEENIKRIALQKSQQEKAELMENHFREELAMRKDAFAKKLDSLNELRSIKNRMVRLRQLQEAHELALEQSQNATERAASFSRETKFLQKQLEDRREFNKAAQERRAENLRMRQMAVQTSKKDVDARFLKREQDRERQNLRDYLEREAEQLRTTQSMELAHSQAVFDLREEQGREIAKLEAALLREYQGAEQEIRDKKHQAKLDLVRRLYEMKTADLERAHVLERQEMQQAQELEAKQQETALIVAAEDRTETRRVDDNELRNALSKAITRVSGSTDDDSVAVVGSFHGGTNESVSDSSTAASVRSADVTSSTAQQLLSEAEDRAKALFEEQEKARRVQREASQQRAQEALKLRKDTMRHVVDEAKKERLKLKLESEAMLQRLSEKHLETVEKLKQRHREEVGKLLEVQSEELVAKQRVYMAELEALERKGKSELQELKASFPLERKYEQLLHQILPESIASSLAAGQNLIANSYSDVAVVFLDIVSFTSTTQAMNAVQLVKLLNVVFQELDRLAQESEVVRIKTIGDAYMCVSNVPDPVEYPARRAADFALAARRLFRTNEMLRNIQVRIGIAWGNVVAGVIGTQKPSFDVWGTVVNIASRMEHLAPPGEILVTEAMANELQEAFELEDKGYFDVKGAGRMRGFRLAGRRQLSPQERNSVQQLSSKT